MLDPGSFPCSRYLPYKLSPPNSGPRKSPTAAGLRGTGLGVRKRNVTVILSPNADLSPKLGAWPIYSTSFFGRDCRRLVLLGSRKVGIPLPPCSPARDTANPLTRPPTPYGALDREDLDVGATSQASVTARQRSETAAHRLCTATDRLQALRPPSRASSAPGRRRLARP
jgi:hypothetical protein